VYFEAGLSQAIRDKCGSFVLVETLFRAGVQKSARCDYVAVPRSDKS
jgi:hypothetical protein